MALVFLQTDAQIYPFARQGFDVAISRHGATFFDDPVAAFMNIARGLQGLRQPMFFGRDIDDACHFICGQFGWMLHEMDDQSKAHAVGALRVSMASHLTDDGVFYDSSAWLIEATATS